MIIVYNDDEYFKILIIVTTYENKLRFVLMNEI